MVSKGVCGREKGCLVSAHLLLMAWLLLLLVLAYDLLSFRLVWPVILVSVGVTRIVKPYEKVLQGF